VLPSALGPGGPAFVLACLALVPASAGCSISATFSVSDSSSASGASRSPQRRECAYRDDVRDLLVSGLKGVFFSLLELAFFNIRKGSFEHVGRPRPDGPAGTRGAELS
jgi:hypothetical protein